MNASGISHIHTMDGYIRLINTALPLAVIGTCLLNAVNKVPMLKSCQITHGLFQHCIRIIGGIYRLRSRHLRYRLSLHRCFRRFRFGFIGCMKRIGNGLAVSITEPHLLNLVPAEFVLLQNMAYLVGRLAVKTDFQGTALDVIRNGKSISICLRNRLLGFHRLFFNFGLSFFNFAIRFFNCSFNFCSRFINCFHFGNGSGIFIFGNNHFLGCHGLLVVLHSLYSHLIPHLHDAVHVFNGIANLIFQCVGSIIIVSNNAVKILSQILYKLFQLFQQFLENCLMLLSELLYERRIRQDIRHSICYNLTAGSLIIQPGFLHLQFDQRVCILTVNSALVQFIKHSSSEFIVLDGIPIFNKVIKFMGESAQQHISFQVFNLGNILKSCVNINVDGARLVSSVSTLLPNEVTFCICLRFIQYNVHTGSLSVGT